MRLCLFLCNFTLLSVIKVKGLFWLFVTTSGITINSAVTVTEICEFLDEKGRNMGKFEFKNSLFHYF